MIVILLFKKIKRKEEKMDTMDTETYIPKNHESISKTTQKMVALSKETAKQIICRFNGITLSAFPHWTAERVANYYFHQYGHRVGADHYSAMPSDTDKRKTRALMRIIERIIAKHHLGENALDDPSFHLFELAKRIVWAENETALLDALKALDEFGKKL